MRLLLIEDDMALCLTLTYQIEKQGLLVDVCHNGEDGLHLIRQQAHDLILLDRMLPLMDGIEVLKKMRSEKISTPVILVTALGDLHAKINGLDCGADDYLVKPFEFEELMARVRSIFRRPRRWESNQLLSYGDLCYDSAAKKLSLQDKTLSLSKKEGELIELLLRNAGQTLPRATILARVWGPEADIEDGNLDNYIHFLRRHLADLNSSLVLITVRGVGYRLEERNA